MKEIFKCIEPRAHCEHLENDTLLLLTHSPAIIISTIKARPHLMLLIIIACKENYHVIAKVINFVVDSPARKMKAKNKKMHFFDKKNKYPTVLMSENNQILYIRFQCTDVYGCPKLLDME